MSKTLSCKHTASRLYATRFLRVLLRTPLRKHLNYAAWVIELLVNQLHDEDKAISLAAINALDEACDCKVIIFILYVKFVWKMMYKYIFITYNG